MPEGGRRVRVGERGRQRAGVVERRGEGRVDWKVLRCCLGSGGRGAPSEGMQVASGNPGDGFAPEAAGGRTAGELGAVERLWSEAERRGMWREPRGVGSPQKPEKAEQRGGGLLTP